MEGKTGEDLNQQERNTIQKALELSQSDPGGPRAPGEKVVNLNVYRIQKALRQEGFDLVLEGELEGPATTVARPEAEQHA